MTGPGDEVLRAAESDLDRIAKTSASVTLGSVLVAAIGAGLGGVGVLPQLSLLAAAGGFTFGCLYGIAWRRARAARSSLRAGQTHAVHAVGWCRPPDGCNYALFLTDEVVSPDVVVRLPLRREVRRSTDGWVYGSLKPSRVGGVALVGDRGLLATGRVVSRRTAKKKWRRRETEPSRWVQRPPKNWKPPAGE